MMSQNVGFSQNILDPRYQRFHANSKKGTLIFAVILASLALIGFPIYGAVSHDMELGTSILIGVLLAAMFVIIALVQLYKQKKDFTWDGTIIDKQIRERQHSQNPDDQNIQHITEYIYKVKRDDGRTITHRAQNNPLYYNYFNIGDRVRHHKGFHVYEKYDKSNDEIIICVACSTTNNIQNEICTRCKCPLLKD